MLGSGATTASARDAVLWRAPIDPERARDLRLRVRAMLTAALNPPSARGVFRLQIKAVGKHRRIKLGDWRQPWLRVAGALLLLVSAGIHLALYVTGYRAIPTIGWLFLVQFIVAFVLAAGALVTHSRLVAIAGAGLALSTLGAYLLAVHTGLFGYKEIRTRAGIAAGLIEVAAFATLMLAAVITNARTETVPDRPRPRMLAGVRRAVSLVVGAVGAVSVAALVLFGIAVASAGGEPAAAAGAGAVLKTANIGGVTVLTNAKGFTLYLFSPDTPATSRCTGSCVGYWPPVTGSPQAGPGVTGKLGMIKRPGGAEQATYGGHPLYTYIGDSTPGQANGNKLNLNGGYWYEVRVSG
jgi:predicted lipoprotein with Yx(FWY)xxD motif